jgi:hypothetical protein
MPCSVRRGQGLRNLDRERERLAGRNRTLRDSISQRRSFDELHHQRLDAAAVFEAVQRGDIRMIERRQDFGFALKAREPIAIAGQFCRQDFDGDVTLQACIEGAVHLAHPTGADRFLDFVRSDSGSKGKQRHAERGDYS